MTTFEFNKYGPCDLRVETSRYERAGLAVLLNDAVDDEPFTVASVNVPGLALAAEFVFKTYSENDGLLEAMTRAGIVEQTGRFVDVGVAGAQPICRLLKR